MLSFQDPYRIRNVSARIRSVEETSAAVPVLDDLVGLLSAQERDVAQRAAKGMRNIDISSDLGISEATVKQIMRMAMKKLCVSRRTMLQTRYGVRLDAASDEGLTDRQARSLSQREMLLASHVVAGMSNKELANQLNIAEATVKVHLKSIFAKTGSDNRTHFAGKWIAYTRRTGGTLPLAAVELGVVNAR